MKNLRNLFSGILPVLAVLLLTGCGEKDNPVRTSLDVDTSTLTLSVGESAVRMAFSKAEDATITYTSSKPAVATVDQFGKVTAMSEGTATITIEMAETKKSWYAAKTITYNVVVKNVSATDSKNATAAKTLAEATAGDIGKIAGKDGKIYATKADAEAVATGNAVAMIAYVGTASDCAHGLAIQLNASPEEKNWNDAKTYASGLTAVPGGTWRLPSKADWQNMFVGCAKDGDDSDASDNALTPIAGFKEKIGATGITWYSEIYWSRTDTGSGTSAWYVLVVLSGSTNANFNTDYTSTSYKHYVLGCLAF